MHAIHRAMSFIYIENQYFWQLLLHHLAPHRAPWDGFTPWCWPVWRGHHRGRCGAVRSPRPQAKPYRSLRISGRSRAGCRDAVGVVCLLDLRWESDGCCDLGQRRKEIERQGHNRYFVWLLTKNEYNIRCGVLYLTTIDLQCVVVKTFFLVARGKNHLFQSPGQFCLR